MEKLPPLDPAPIAQLGGDESWLEKAGKYVLIVGRLGLDIAYRRRAQPVYEAYCRQLEQRSALDPDRWGKSALQECAAWVTPMIQSTIGWPNDRFLPDDPCTVLFWSYTDGLEIVELFMDLGERLELDFSDETIDRVTAGTLQEFLELIVMRQDASLETNQGP